MYCIDSGLIWPVDIFIVATSNDDNEVYHVNRDVAVLKCGSVFRCAGHSFKLLLHLHFVLYFYYDPILPTNNECIDNMDGHRPPPPTGE